MARRMLAVDSSKHAEQAFNWYMDMVHKEGDYLILIHVPEMVAGTTAQSALAFSPIAWQEMAKREETVTQTLKKQYEHKMKENKVPGKWMTAQTPGKPGEAIVKLAEKEGVELVIMGTRGMSTVRRTKLGDVSSYVVHHAHCPVGLAHAK